MEVWLPVVVLFLAVIKVSEWMWALVACVLRKTNIYSLIYGCHESGLSKEDIVREFAMKLSADKFLHKNNRMTCPSCWNSISVLKNKEHEKCFFCGANMARYKNDLYIDKSRMIRDYDEGK